MNSTTKKDKHNPKTYPREYKSQLSYSQKQKQKEKQIEEENKEIVISTPQPTFENLNVREIDLTDLQRDDSDGLSRQNRGPCVGCGIPESPMRFVTREYLCASCRTQKPFKLITKTTALRQYPNLTFHDLINNFTAQKIRCFFIRNWKNPRAADIKLYYDKEIERISLEK